MKNISRRVFIKGLAVAGVAAAASTVLAGCNTNMIPGTDNEGEGEVVPTPSNTYTFKDGDKTLSIKAGDLKSGAGSTANTENVAFVVSVVNGLGGKLKFGTAVSGATASAAGQYFVEVTGKYEDDKGQSMTLAATSFGTTDTYLQTNLLKSDTSIAANGGGGDYAMGVKGLKDNWTKLTLTLKVFKSYAKGTTYKYDTKEPEDKTTFTFTNK